MPKMTLSEDMQKQLDAGYLELGAVLTVLMPGWIIRAAEQKKEIDRLWGVVRNQSDKSSRFRVLRARAHRAEAKVKSLKEETVSLGDYEKLEAKHEEQVNIECGHIRSNNKDLKTKIYDLKVKLAEMEAGSHYEPRVALGYAHAEVKDLKAEIYDLKAKLAEYKAQAAS